MDPSHCYSVIDINYPTPLYNENSLFHVSVLTVPDYDVRVNRSTVLKGCNAVLSCTAREDVKEHLTVTSWFRDEAILLPGSTDTGECRKPLSPFL